ncbi:GIY-YIG nuclease family protein [bacterium SCSIO 12741]|nr:GIY-YIG nuclease family protein [bacterium SCSIO 12741]
MYFVYIIQSESTGALYKGQSQDVDTRLKQHNSGKTKSTKSGIPWKLIYKEEYETLEEALKRERYLKTAAGRRWIKKNVLAG